MEHKTSTTFMLMFFNPSFYLVWCPSMHPHYLQLFSLVFPCTYLWESSWRLLSVSNSWLKGWIDVLLCTGMMKIVLGQSIFCGSLLLSSSKTFRSLNSSVLGVNPARSLVREGLHSCLTPELTNHFYGSFEITHNFCWKLMQHLQCFHREYCAAVWPSTISHSEWCQIFHPGPQTSQWGTFQSTYYSSTTGLLSRLFIQWPILWSKESFGHIWLSKIRDVLQPVWRKGALQLKQQECSCRTMQNTLTRAHVEFSKYTIYSKYVNATTSILQ